MLTEQVKSNPKFDILADNNLPIGKRVYQALKLFQEGLTVMDLKQLLPKFDNPNAVSASIHNLKKMGSVKIIGVKVNDGGYRVSVYKATDKVPEIGNVKIKLETKPKPVKPTKTDAALKVELDAALKKIEELQAWKEQAIKRCPELAIHPLMFEARRRAAATFIAKGDFNSEKAIMAGDRDSSPIVETVFKLLMEFRNDD